MFKNSFSFYGRIRRLEFGLSVIIANIYAYACIFGVAFIYGVFGYGEFDETLFYLLILPLYVPLYWFMLAQGAKRCHDKGNSGWYQIIPFYVFWMLFSEGDYGINEYGPNPKGLCKETLEDRIESIGTRVDN